MKTYLKILTVMVFIGVSHTICGANNLSIGNVSVGGQNSDEGTAVISFDISWDNSWRSSMNHDAVWLFIKFSRDDGISWEHATLDQYGENPVGTFAGSRPSTDMIIPQDRKGCFIRRATVGYGSFESEGVELTWNWREDELDEDVSVSVRVIGIEMVYVPEGPFYAGDGDGTSGAEYSFRIPGAAHAYVGISESSAMLSCAPSLNDDIDDTPIEIRGPGGVIGENEHFPTGYKAFYMMKYPITEGQWVDFFNMLPASALDARDITGPLGKDSQSTVNRNTVSRAGSLASTERPDRPCGFLSWQDIAAYASWAALRPMTELEYEKAARGAEILPVTGEFAWGDTGIVQALAVSGAETGAETVTTAGANAVYGDITISGGDGGEGPLRAGIFATSTSTRRDAGAGFYGAMELSGNLWERVVTIGNSVGRAFQGSHGTGKVTSGEGYEGHEGNALNSDWPGYVAGRGVSGYVGSGFRGGSWETDEQDLAVSSRRRASASSGARLRDSGGRCVRTAP